MSAYVCAYCRQPITDAAEQFPRYYRIVSADRVIGNHKHEACHKKYLAEKSGVVAADGPLELPPSSAPPVLPDDAVEKAVNGHPLRPVVLDDASKDTGARKGCVTFQYDGRTVSVPRTELDRTLRMLNRGSRRGKPPLSLGVLMRAKLKNGRRTR